MQSQKEDDAPGVEKLREEVAFLRRDVDHIRSAMQDMHREVGETPSADPCSSISVSALTPSLFFRVFFNIIPSLTPYVDKTLSFSLLSYKYKVMLLLPIASMYWL